MSTWPKKMLWDRTRPQPARFVRRQQLVMLKWQNHLVSCSGYMLASVIALQEGTLEVGWLG